MLFSFFHNFVKLKLVILFSRLISLFPIFNRVHFHGFYGLKNNQIIILKTKIDCNRL